MVGQSYELAAKEQVPPGERRQINLDPELRETAGASMNSSIAQGANMMP